MRMKGCSPQPVPLAVTLTDLHCGPGQSSRMDQGQPPSCAGGLGLLDSGLPPFLLPETELLFLRRLQDVRAEEGQDVCLEVETGREGTPGAVRWMRGGDPLPPDSRLCVAQEGHVHRLFIHGVVLADQGTYGCESHHDRTLARLSVRRECPAF